MDDQPMSLIDFLMRGGWIMVPIALSSVAVIAVGVSRFIILNRERAKLDEFAREWSPAPSTVDASRFRAACKMGPEVVAEMAEVFEDAGVRRSEAAERLETTGRRFLFSLESGIGTIATLAAVTPLLGFLGTVTGMIRAFMKIEALSGKVNANVLAGGIWEALITTAAGLTVGILALIIHNYLTGMVRTVAGLIEQSAAVTLRILGAHRED